MSRKTSKKGTISEVEVPKLSCCFMTPLLKTGVYVSLKEFLESYEQLTHENRVGMLIQLNQYLFRLQRDPTLEDEVKKMGMLSLSDVGIKKKDVKGACDMSTVISRLGDIYCFVLTGGTETKYSDNFSVENLVCQDKYIALDIIRKTAKGDIDTVEGVLSHPFHWSDAKKIHVICQTFDYINAEIDSFKVDEKESKMYDKRIDDQQSSEGIEMKGCKSKWEYFVKKYDVGENFEIVPKGWVSKLVLDKHDCLTIKKRIKESRRGNDREPDNDIIYNLIFNKTNQAQKKKDPNYKKDDILELLRFFRNRHAHYWEFNNRVRLAFGSHDSGYWKFFSRKFPKLFMYIYENVLPKTRVSSDHLHYDNEVYLTPNIYLPDVG